MLKKNTGLCSIKDYRFCVETNQKNRQRQAYKEHYHPSINLLEFYILIKWRAEKYLKATKTT